MPLGQLDLEIDYSISFQDNIDSFIVVNTYKRMKNILLAYFL